MSSRVVAGRASVVVSLILIALIAIAQFGKPRPHAEPSGETKTAVPVLVQPQVMAIPHVVLPPPPAQSRTSKALTAAETTTPRSAQVEQISASVEAKRPDVPKAPSSSTAADAAVSHPRQAEPKPTAEQEPPRRIARDEPLRPVPSARQRPAAKTAATEQPVRTTVVSKEETAEGRTLLRLLEHGSGPSIELAWPDAARQREKLFTLLGRCFGMQIALIDGQGRLFTANGRPNAPWTLNLDRFSGFIREPAGALSEQERRAARRIRAHHDNLLSASPVRVFPRLADARLLGGLRRLIGESYAASQVIRARYRISGRRLLVERIVADGRMIRGRLELLPVARGVCSRRPGA